MHQASRLVFALLLSTAVTACGGGGSTPTSPLPPSLGIPFSTTELRVGTGNLAQNGARVVVSYTGWLYEPAAVDNKGTQFDSGTLPAFILGGGGVIAGFERGVSGMRVGGLRRVIIPPELGYGTRGSGTSIPPNATLIFEIELLASQ